MTILPAAVVRAWEEERIREGVEVRVLMEEAVAGIFQVLRPHLAPQDQIVVLCGKGHNGNDGLALVRLLVENGYAATAVLSSPASERTPHPMPEIQAWTASCPVWPSVSIRHHGNRRIVVDALTGLGATGPLRGKVREMVQWAVREKTARDFYVSLDLPAGVDAATGEVFEPVFPADLTVALGAVKEVMLQPEVRAACGLVRGVDLSSLGAIPGGAGKRLFINHVAASAMLRRWPFDVHKHSRGRVGILAGSPGMAGAAVLAAGAAVHAGAGLVRLYIPQGAVGPVLPGFPEVILRFLEPGRGLPADFFENHALVIGPGLGRGREAFRRIGEAVEGSNCPLVLDADALRWVADTPVVRSGVRPPCILTPHAGEMAALIGRDCGNPWAVALDWVEHRKEILVLKGPSTLVADHTSGISMNGSGNPGMASAGMGDVLAGILGGLLSQGYDPAVAARLGVFWHGAAGDHLALTLSEPGVTASRVIDTLGLAWRHLLRDS